MLGSFARTQSQVGYEVGRLVCHTLIGILQQECTHLPLISFEQCYSLGTEMLSSTALTQVRCLGSVDTKDRLRSTPACGDH